jgi:hypothetical protein
MKPPGQHNKQADGVPIEYGNEMVGGVVKDLNLLGTDVASRSAREFAEMAMLTLNVNAIAVALQVGGLPRDWRSSTHQALIDLAIAGIRKVGIEEVVRLKSETAQLEDALMRPGRRPEVEVERARRRFRQIWSSHRRCQEAVDAAYTILHPGNYGLSLPSGRTSTAA